MGGGWAQACFVHMKGKSLDKEFSTEMPQNLYERNVLHETNKHFLFPIFLRHCSYEVEREKKKEEEIIQLKYYSFFVHCK